MSSKNPPHETSHDNDGPAQDDVAGQEDREASFSRRGLIHAGWSVPVVMAVNPPRVFAISPHSDAGGAHGDAAPGGHVDTFHGDGLTHSDLHVDSPGPPHADAQPHIDVLIHSDIPPVHGDSSPFQTDP